MNTSWCSIKEAVKQQQAQRSRFRVFFLIMGSDSLRLSPTQPRQQQQNVPPQALQCSIDVRFYLSLSKSSIWREWCDSRCTLKPLLRFLMNSDCHDYFMSADTNSIIGLPILHSAQFHWYQCSYFWCQTSVPKCSSAKLVPLSKYPYYTQKIRKLALPGTLNIFLMNAVINSSSNSKDQLCA